MSAVLEAREPSARYLAAEQPPLVRQFGLLATAPGGVARLRDLILTLAVRGKLLPQDPNDEPATELLRKINAEKSRLASAGRIQRERPSPEVLVGDEPFELPPGWAWVRLPQISYDLGQGTPLTPFTYIDVAAIDNERALVTDAVEVVQPSEAPSRARKRVSVGTVIYSTVRPYLKNIAIVEKAYTPSAIVSTAFAVMHPHSGVNAKYLLNYLRSAVFTEFVASKMAGIAYPAINDSSFFSGVVALPPTSEQARIVARVDELMRLCDALEAQGRLEAEQHARLLGTLLGTLTDSSTPEELAANWQRVADHFDLLLDRPEAVDSLEQTILQLAVRGMLVPQDANDETASDLLARVRAEKERLIRVGKLKDQRPLAEIDDVPFDIPRRWAWARLGELGNSFDYGSSQKSCEDTAAVPILRMGNVQAGRVVFGNLKFLKDQKEELPSLLLEEGDLLFNRTNSFELVGKTGLFEGFGRPVTFASYLIRIRPNESLCDPRYMNIFMNTQDCRKTEIEPDLTQQTGQANYNGTKLRNIRVPLPPREEQARIVTRVTELRRVCAELRQRLAACQITQSHLAVALVDEVA